MIKLPIEIGDILLVGRFKNKRIKVKEIGTDEHGLPTVNGRGILKIRIEKLMEPKKNLKESNQLSFHDIDKGDRIQYIIPGTTTKLSTGIVKDKDSTKHEDYLIVIDDHSRKEMNIFMSHVGDIIKKSKSGLNKFKQESKQFSLAQTAKKILKEAKKPETGLMVIGKTPLDNNAIGDMIEELGYYAEWNSREGYWLFPEEEDTYDGLEAELNREFSKRGINARFEGIF